MKKISILLLTPFFHPHIGGSQRYMEEIYSELLKKHKEISADVLCYNTDGVENKSRYRGLNITRINCLNIITGQFALPNPISLIKYLYQNRRKYDLIHCSTRFFDTAWWGPVYARLINKPIILTDHCAYHPGHRNFVISYLSKLIDLTIVKFSLNFYTKIISTNYATKEFIKSVFQQNSEIIYGGIDSEVFKPALKKDRKLHIIFVGRMIDSKGVRLLFNHAKLNSKIKFTFAGPGYLKQGLRELVNKQRLRNINIYGKLEKNEVANLMRTAYILVHPSFHSEGFPNILTEAGASKLAVIATNSGGTNEIIINRKTGLLIEPKNQKSLNKALDLLIKNKKLREEYAENLYNFVKEKFDWRKSADLQYSLIQSLVN